MSGSAQDDVGQGGPADEQAAEEFVERFAGHLTEGGMQRMGARVFARLLVEESGTLTAGELAERLQVSPAAVSGAVGYLAQVHLVTRERQPGSRRERYRVDNDVWVERMASYTVVLNRWLATVQDGMAAVGPDTRAGRRLNDTAEFLEFFNATMTSALHDWQARGRGRAT